VKSIWRAESRTLGGSRDALQGNGLRRLHIWGWLAGELMPSRGGAADEFGGDEGSAASANRITPTTASHV